MRSTRVHPIRIKLASPAPVTDRNREEQVFGVGGEAQVLERVCLPVFGVILPEQGEKLAARLLALSGVERARVDFYRQTLTVEFLPQVMSLGALQQRIRSMGFELGVDAEEGEVGLLRRPGRLEALALLFALLTGGVWLVSHFPVLLSAQQRILLSVGGFLGSTLAMIILGTRLLATVRSDLRGLAPTVPTYLFLVNVVAYFWSVIAYLVWGENAFHISAGVSAITVLWVWSDLLARRRANRHVDAIEASLPAWATVVRRGGRFRVRPETVQETDDVVVEVGDLVPVDGIVAHGQAELAEGFPQGTRATAGPGEHVWAGCRVESGNLVLKSERKEPRRGVLLDLADVVTAARATAVPGDRARQWLERRGAWVALALAVTASIIISNFILLELPHGTLVFACLLCFPFPAFNDVRDLVLRSSVTRLLRSRFVVIRPDRLLVSRRTPVFVLVDRPTVQLPHVMGLLEKGGRKVRRWVPLIVVPPGLEAPQGLPPSAVLVPSLTDASLAITRLKGKRPNAILLADMEAAQSMTLSGVSHILYGAFWSERFKGELACRLVEMGPEGVLELLPAMRAVRRRIAGLTLLILAGCVASIGVFVVVLPSPLAVAGIAFGTAIIARLWAGSH